MASSPDFAEYVMDILSDLHLEVRCNRMFGEYCIYANDKPIMFIFNDMVCVKQHPSVEGLMQGSYTIDPFENSKIGGNKQWLVWVLDIERSDIEEVVYQLEKLLPMPRPKRKKGKKKPTK